MRVAIVHDWLVAPGGAERVLEQIIACFPDADLFSLVDFLEDRRFLGGKPVTTSFIQSLPFARRRHRAYLPLIPLAIGQFDLSDYDLIVSSSPLAARGILTGPAQIHVSYVHSPMRYAWDLQHEYLREANLTRGPKSWIVRAWFHYLRGWDSHSANSADRLIASSRLVARHVMKTCRRDAAVIPPPVDVHRFEPRMQKEDFYLSVSRMVPDKRIELIVETFNATPHRKLVVIGDGPEMAAIRAKAGPNVTILARSRSRLSKITCDARAPSFSPPKKTSAPSRSMRRRAARRSLHSARAKHSRPWCRSARCVLPACTSPARRSRRCSARLTASSGTAGGLRRRHAARMQSGFPRRYSAAPSWPK